MSTKEAALEIADALIAVPEWQKIKAPDHDTLREVQTDPVVFDACNLYESAPSGALRVGLLCHRAGQRGQSVMSSPIVSIIVVSYNTVQMTLDCLQSVKDQTTLAYELIVVDNNSPDGSAKAVAEAHPDVTLLAETVNHWFAGGCNLGAARARGEYILQLNPDTVILDGAIDALVRFARETPQAKIWGGRTFDGQMRPDPASCWRRMTPWKLFCRATGLTAIFKNTTLFNGEAMGGWDRTTERAVDIVSGCFFLMRRTDWETMGGFDPTFVMYGEEADLCLRATQQIGAAPRITPTARLIHYGGASDTMHTEKMIRLLSAKAELIKRHFSPATRELGLWLHRMWPLSRMIATRAMAQGSAVSWSEVWARRAEWKSGFEMK